MKTSLIKTTLAGAILATGVYSAQVSAFPIVVNFDSVFASSTFTVNSSSEPGSLEGVAGTADVVNSPMFGPVAGFEAVEWFNFATGANSSLLLEDTPDSGLANQVVFNAVGESNVLQRFTQTNNVIDGTGSWSAGVFNWIQIPGAMAPENSVESLTGVTFTETLNIAGGDPAACGTNNTNTVCEDIYDVGPLPFETVNVMIDNFANIFSFDVVPTGGTICVPDNGSLTCYTPETNPGNSGIEVVMTLVDRFEKVPAPATLALLGLGLVGIGFSRRGKKLQS